MYKKSQSTQKLSYIFLQRKFHTW